MIFPPAIKRLYNDFCTVWSARLYSLHCFFYVNIYRDQRSAPPPVHTGTAPRARLFTLDLDFYFKYKARISMFRTPAELVLFFVSHVLNVGRKRRERNILCFTIVSNNDLSHYYWFTYIWFFICFTGRRSHATVAPQSEHNLQTTESQRARLLQKHSTGYTNVCSKIQRWDKRWISRWAIKMEIQKKTTNTYLDKPPLSRSWNLLLFRRARHFVIFARRSVFAEQARRSRERLLQRSSIVSFF